MKPLNPWNPQAEHSAELYREAYASALRLLARREHSERELHQKLIARRFSDTLIDQVLAQLIDAGLLSDSRFAELYARGRIERGYGPLRIQAELRKRGVSGALTERTLAESTRSWIESARQERSKRFGPCIPADHRERAKQMRFLQQRGFTGEQIRAVFAEG